VSKALLRFVDARTDYWIYMSRDGIPEIHDPNTLILHGHYVGWLATYERAPREIGLFLTFGHIRRYKGIEELARCFAAAALPGTHLLVAGKPQDGLVRAELEGIVLTAANVSLELRRLSNEELISRISSAELVLLCYRDMYNSGALLLALSAGRPAIVPRTATNEGLAEEVGEGWITMYEPPLTAEKLVDAIARARSGAQPVPPQLDLRDWRRLGAEIEGVYHAAIARRRNPTG
jgi:glycosyltransferase involved in cell wall biosynthesis